MTNIAIIAHRCNRIDDVYDALDNNANGIECDVQLTADGHVVLWHDRVLECGTIIAETSYEKVFQITQAELFEDYIDTIATDLPNGFKLYVELKNAAKGLSRAVLDILAHARLSQPIILLSFITEQLEDANKLSVVYPEINVRLGQNVAMKKYLTNDSFCEAYSIDSMDDFDEDKFKSIGIDLLSFDHRLIVEVENMQSLKGFSLPIITWTVNDTILHEHIGLFKDIITDKPELFI